MTDTQLKAEITGDPANMGYAGKAAAQVVAIINAPKAGVTFPKIVDVATILGVMIEAPGRIARFADSTKTGEWNQILANIRSLKEGFRPSDAPVAAMLQKALNEAVITSAEKATIEALGLRPGSRAEELWGEGTVVSLNNVARVI